MNINSLLKIQSLVGSFVFTLVLLVGQSAGAQTAPITCPPGQVLTSSVTDGRVTQYCADSQNSAICTTLYNEFRAAQTKVNAIPMRTQTQLRACSSQEEHAGEEDFESEEETGSEEYCEASRANNCGLLDDVSPSEVLRDAEERNSEMQKDMMEQQQRAQSQQRSLRNRLEQIQQRRKEADRNLALSIEAVQKDLDAKNKNIDQQLRAQMAALRQQMTAKREALSQVNDSVRSAELALFSAKTGWEANCRTEAVQKLESVKAEMKKKDEESKAKGEKYNFAGSSLAGASGRKREAQRRQQQLDYVNSYKDCIGGISGAGAQSKKAVTDATEALALANKAAVERRKTLEQELKDMMADYADAQTASLENKDTLKKEAEAKVNQANAAYQTAVERADTDARSAQEELTSSIQNSQQMQTLALSNSRSAQTQLQAAQSRIQCVGPGRPVTSNSSSSTNRSIDQLADIGAYDSVLAEVCQMKSTCSQLTNVSQCDSREEAPRPAATPGSTR